MKDEFQNEGLADDFLLEFRKTWNSKLMNSNMPKNNQMVKK